MLSLGQCGEERGWIMAKVHKGGPFSRALWLPRRAEATAAKVVLYEPAKEHILSATHADTNISCNSHGPNDGSVRGGITSSSTGTLLWLYVVCRMADVAGPRRPPIVRDDACQVLDCACTPSRMASSRLRPIVG